MTDNELNEIEARAKAATPGPWVYDTAEIMSIDKAVVSAEYPEDGFDNEANGQFCAHAREDIPALIAEVRHLKACLVPSTVERPPLRFGVEE